MTTTRAAAVVTVPQNGNAEVVFLQALNGSFSSGPITRVAIDGSWVGAAKGKSWFAFPLAPGKHTLCAQRQSKVKDERDQFAIARLDAAAGRRYLYTFTITRQSPNSPTMRIGPEGVPGSSMTAQESEPIDSVSLAEAQADDDGAWAAKLPVSVAVRK